MRDFIRGAANLISMFGLLFLAVLLDGWVLTVLWGWFVVPAFGLPVISLKNAVGLGIIVNRLVGVTFQKGEKKEESSEYDTPLTRLITFPVLALLIGWVVHSC